jgi:hypothetical protein
MTLPAHSGPEPIVIRKVVDAHPEDISDAITEFAAREKLEHDPRYQGDAIRLVPKGDSESQLFRRHDVLDIRLEPDGHVTTVTFTATMAGLHERGARYQRGRYVRGAIISALFIGAGVVGLTKGGVSIGDFVPMAIGVGIGRGAVRGARGEIDSRDDYERKVARTLASVFDEVEQ